MKIFQVALFVTLLIPTFNLTEIDNESNIVSYETLCSGKVIRPLIFERNELFERLGKCYGYANCSACTTCSSCQYCNSGGTCGVCSVGHSKPDNNNNSGGSSSSSNKKRNEKSIRTSSSSNTTKLQKQKNSNIVSSSIFSSSTNTKPLLTAAKYEIIVNMANLRNRPNRNAAIVGKLKLGTRFALLDKSETKENIVNYGSHYWYFIKTENITGWVYGALIDDYDPSLKMVTADRINVRSDASVINGNILFQLNKGDKVSIVSSSTFKQTIKPWGAHYWFKVEVNNKTGWIFGAFINN